MLYKAMICFVLVFSYPIYLLLTNFAATVQDYKMRGITAPIYVRAFRICVWLFVLFYLCLFLNYCFEFYVQCKIRYSPGWSAKVEKMGRSVCFDPDLPPIDSSRQFCLETDNHVNNEPANQIPETKPATVSHSQISKQDESSRQHVSCTFFKPLSIRSKGVSRIHGLINLVLTQRLRRDFVGPRSPLKPFTLTDPPNLLTPYNTVMGLALAQRQRREFIGPRPALNPFLLAGSLAESTNLLTPYNTVMGLALAQRRRKDFIGPRPSLNPFLLADDALD